MIIQDRPMFCNMEVEELEWPQGVQIKAIIVRGRGDTEINLLQKYTRNPNHSALEAEFSLLRIYHERTQEFPTTH